MTLISLDSVSKSLGEGPLFRDVSFGIEEGERIGFVGPNGCGKSTLLRLLSGRLEADEGAIARKRSLVVNILDQNPAWEEGDTIRDFLFRGDDPVVRLVGRYEACLEALHGTGPGAAAASRAAEAELPALTHEMERRGGFEVEHRFASFLSELGIDDLNLPMNTLSGGMVKKAALARCLAPESELVFLDEPTNHLDLDTIEWLEKKLLSSERAFVLVTHDRWFLDAVCLSILEIDRGRVRKYAGSYSDYLANVAAREAEAERHEQRREAILRVELEWLKRGPKARTGKDKKRQGRIRDMVDGRPEADAPGQDAFQTGSRRLGGKVLELRGVSKSYGGRAVISPFSFRFTRGDRLGVVGPNGSGKSTLLDLISGRIEPDSGSVERGETVVVGYFDQKAAVADPAVEVVEFVRKAAERIRLNDGTDLSAEQFLERFAFPRPMQGQPVGKLSGGELKRLLLVRLLISSPNVLILDEPTNDFDIPTIALLEDFLDSFPGCVVTVSHDRAFLESAADLLLILDGKGGIVSYVGSYADWRAEKAAVEAGLAAAQSAGRRSVGRQTLIQGTEGAGGAAAGDRGPGAGA
jgi:ATP-binding cassette subfamily F protein uup